MPIFGFKLDPNTHDLVIENGQIAIISDDEVIARNLKTRLLTLKGEWILDKNYGFEYRNVLGFRSVDLQLIESSLKDYILATEGVQEITLFKFDYDGGDSRKLIVTFSVLSDLGEIITLEGINFGQ